MFSPSTSSQLTVQNSMKSTPECTILMDKILKNTPSPGHSLRCLQLRDCSSPIEPRPPLTDSLKHWAYCFHSNNCRFIPRWLDFLAALLPTFEVCCTGWPGAEVLLLSVSVSPEVGACPRSRKSLLIAKYLPPFFQLNTSCFCSWWINQTRNSGTKSPKNISIAAWAHEAMRFTWRTFKHFSRAGLSIFSSYTMGGGPTARKPPPYQLPFFP